jgi:hypothetical protein
MKYLSDTPLKGRLLAIPTNIPLGWKSLSGTNTLSSFIQYTSYAENRVFSMLV